MLSLNVAGGTSASPSCEPASAFAEVRPFSDPARRVLNVALLALAAAFALLHFAHLAADFPNNSPWMDWAKYTDEGWYGDAAIRYFQLGHWNVPGDFNPAAALPVWPLLEAAVFALTGVSLVAARALAVTVFLGILTAAWFLVERTRAANWTRRTGARCEPGPRHRKSTGLAASTGVLLLAVSPFCFVFSRMAILEPPMVLFTLLALLAASSASPLPARRLQSLGKSLRAEVAWLLRRNFPPILLLGVLLPGMVLTKTTAIFLFPAIAWMLFAALNYRLRPSLIVSAPAALLAAGLWSAYFLLVVRPHFMADFRYLFAANQYTGITRGTLLQTVLTTLDSGIWIGQAIYPLAGVAALVALVSWRRLARSPLIPVLLLWIGGYLFFLAYHNNMQPRYYFVIAVPVLLLAPLTLGDLVLPRVDPGLRRSVASVLAAAILGGIAFSDARQTLAFVQHPEYTLVDAARQIASYIREDHRRDPGHSELVLSISGSDLSLITGLHSICDDFGTLELVDRVSRYRPGWYLAWNQIEDDKMEALAAAYAVRRVAVFPAMDDPDRNLLVLYKLLPLELVAKPSAKPRMASGHFFDETRKQPSPPLHRPVHAPAPPIR